MSKKDYSNLIPLGENFLLRAVDPKAVSAGGIHIPDEYQQRAPEGTVVNVGTGPKDDPEYVWEIEPGDKLLMKQYGGTDLGDGWRVCSVRDVLGVLLDNGNEIVPINDNIIVRMLPPKEQVGSIVLADNSKETQEFGVVVGVAEGCEHISEDDFVFVAKTQGAHYRVGGKDFIILSERACKATVAKPE